MNLRFFIFTLAFAFGFIASLAAPVLTDLNPRSATWEEKKKWPEDKYRPPPAPPAPRPLPPIPKPQPIHQGPLVPNRRVNDPTPNNPPPPPEKVGAWAKFIGKFKKH